EREPSLVFLVLGCDSNYWKPERIANLRLKVQVIVLVRKRRLLDVRRVLTIGVLFDECLPCRAPKRRPIPRAHIGRDNRSPFVINPSMPSAYRMQICRID